MTLLTKEITRAEWLCIRVLRGQKTTGYPHHARKRDGRTCHYYWAWGAQPSDKMLNQIGARCPIKAAEKFLVYFKRASGDFSSETQPSPHPFSNPAPKTIEHNVTIANCHDSTDQMDPHHRPDDAAAARQDVRGTGRTGGRAWPHDLPGP